MIAVADLTISRVQHRLRLTDDAQRGPVTALTRALPDALADALDRHGVDPAAIVCIRRVSTQVRLSASCLRSPDSTVERWADGLAAAIERDCLTAHGDGGEVVWFRDRGAVVGDVVARAARGDLGRRWAWAAAGVVRTADPAQPALLVAAVIRRHPQQAASAIRALLAVAPGLLRNWPWPTWVALAESVVGPVRANPTANPERVTRRAARLRATAGFTELVAIVRAAGTSVDPAGLRTDEIPRVARAVVAVTAPELVADPAARWAVERMLVDQGTAAVAEPNLVDAADDQTFEVLPDSIDETNPATGATTFVGGLLFLHHLLTRLGLPARLIDPDHPLAGRPLVESLVALGVALTGADPTDPGLLGFAGRRPGERTMLGRLTDGEQEAVDALVQEIDAALADSLPEPAARLGPALRTFVVQRSARIDGDPGWIEATFAADDADTDIRRAGLDIDPGFLPYLGCVLRFRYV